MKKMYKGKVNSPATLLVETIDSSVTSIKVADGAVFPEGPNVAVIGTDGNAETIKYDSINGNILVGCVRGFQGKASVWDKDTIIARNFTEYDLDALQENISELDKKQLKDFKEDVNHRTVTDSEKEKWNDKIDKSQITDEYSGESQEKVVSQKAVKDLVDTFDSVISSVRSDVDKKAGKSEIPTKISQLINDKTFKTEVEIQELINNSTKLKKEVVTSLPSTGKDDVIYLLKNKNDTNNYYTEYMWISGKWEIIGDTKVDLSEYLKTVNLKSTKLRTNKNNIKTFTDRSTSDHQLDIILGDLELRTEQNKKNIKTKLSEMSEDENHRTVTDSEKEKWNKKFDLPVGKENQVLTKTTDGAEFKNISSSRSATFVIANYDSSENSKAGADYVIQENDCAVEIINNFITKLPEYGGKIQLTEGNFNIKKNLSIDFNKNNTIIEGYGDSTNIIDKLTKDERNNVIVNIITGIENCRLSDLNITHVDSNSINIRGNKNYIKNVNIINNGAYPSLIINDNTSENVLENCTVKNNSNTCYWAKDTSENNKILHCSGTSGDDVVFYIRGAGISLIRCTAENSPKTSRSCFWIGNTNNSLLSCTGISTNGNGFYIKGSNNSLLNCTGTSTRNNPFGIIGSGISLIGCMGDAKSSNMIYDIVLASESKSCIVLGNFYRNIGINNKGTNNVIANNVKLEV